MCIVLSSSFGDIGKARHHQLWNVQICRPNILSIYIRGLWAAQVGFFLLSLFLFRMDALALLKGFDAKRSEEKLHPWLGRVQGYVTIYGVMSTEYINCRSVPT